MRKKLRLWLGIDFDEALDNLLKERVSFCWGRIEELEKQNAALAVQLLNLKKELSDLRAVIAAKPAEAPPTRQAKSWREVQSIMKDEEVNAG